ncbi:DNA cytosine methyltransferase, partial [Streptomyces sp. NPDC005811]
AYADAMGCTWMTSLEARKAVPPAYSQWIAAQFLALEGRTAA